MLISKKELARRLDVGEATVRLVTDRYNIKRVRKGKFIFYEMQNYEFKKIKNFVEERKQNGNKGRNKGIYKQDNECK